MRCPSCVDLNHAYIIGYRAVNHWVTIICADRAEWSRQIWRYINSPPYVTVNMGQTGGQRGSKRDLIPPLKFLGVLPTLFQRKYLVWILRLLPTKPTDGKQTNPKVAGFSLSVPSRTVLCAMPRTVFISLRTHVHSVHYYGTTHHHHPVDTSAHIQCPRIHAIHSVFTGIVPFSELKRG